jgi:hypothetical protein
MPWVPANSIDARAHILSEEASLQSISLAETYAQYSEFLGYSEYRVQGRIDAIRIRLSQTEVIAEQHSGNAYHQEARILDLEMQQARMLHAERDALHYAAVEHHQARRHACQVLHFPLFTEHLQEETRARDANAVAMKSRRGGVLQKTFEKQLRLNPKRTVVYTTRAGIMMPSGELNTTNSRSR